MTITERVFQSRALADAFAEGVEFVNDSALEVSVEELPDGQCRVIIRDDDVTRNDEEEG